MSVAAAEIMYHLLDGEYHQLCVCTAIETGLYRRHDKFVRISHGNYRDVLSICIRLQSDFFLFPTLYTLAHLTFPADSTELQSLEFKGRGLGYRWHLAHTGGI